MYGGEKKRKRKKVEQIVWIMACATEMPKRDASGMVRDDSEGMGRGMSTKHRTPATPAARSTQHTAHSTQHTAHNTQHIAHSTYHTAHSTQHTAHRTPHTAHRIPHTAHSTVW